MEFSGDQLVRKRNFYTQNGNFGLAVDFSVDNPSGRYEFGVSGSNLLSIILESGQVKYDGLFIQNYVPFNNYSALLEITNNKLNYTQNDSEVAYDLSKQTGDYNYFYFKRDNTGINAEFDFYLSGKNLPNYTIDKIGYWFSTGQREVTGNFTNQSGYEVGIFDSFAQGIQNLSYSFSSGFFASGQTSKFKYSGELAEFDFSQPIVTTFYTNFGTFDINFQIIDTSTLNKFVFLDEITDFSFNTDNEINRELFYTNYSGNLITDTFGTELIFKLEYLNGTGSFSVNDFAESAHFTANAYGNFLQSGLVTGRTLIATGNSNITGTYTIDFTRFQWATGAVTGYFSGQGTGMASGINYTGLAYGGFTGFVTGLIQNGSGTFNFYNTFATGFAVDPSVSINYTGYKNATGFINLSGLATDSSFYIGIESTPLVKGLQFNNETGLVYYLSGAPEHKVNSFFSGGLVYITSLYSGELGNGTFIRNFNCDKTDLNSYSPFLTGGINYGSTGSNIYSIGQPFSGFINFVATGSGDYVLPVTAVEAGTFTFTRTFTGAWDLYTGFNQGSLKQVPEISDVLISGRAVLGPNSSLVFQIDHQDSEFNTESAKFIITGSGILNPITTNLSQ